ncbi:MAG: DUF5011 domain-containing protein, partial [Clostridiales bacterium]|nr:DUF5011 domain-containing protein [Clostridiales bacterium]
TRTVTVVAVPQYTKPPVITLDGSAEITMFVDDQYIEPGYKAVDCLGVNLTGAVKVTSNINVMTPGIYTITYEVEDAGGNKAKATRTVFVLEREVEVTPPNAPTLTINGSNPIILHLDSETPYTEQSAKAYDEVDGDISGQVTITGSVDRNKAGVYTLTYKVVNSAGLEATAEREVRIIAPTETKAPRVTYNFSGQGKAVSTTTHSNVVADTDGWMDFAVTSIDKNMTIKVEIKEKGNAKNVIFSNTYTAVGGTQFWAEEGVYDVAVTINAANGNSKYGVRVVTPEVIYFTFEAGEVPLTPFVLSIDLYIVALGYNMQDMLDEDLPFTKRQMYSCLAANGFTFNEMVAFGFNAIELPRVYLPIILGVLLLVAVGAVLTFNRRKPSANSK